MKFRSGMKLALGLVLVALVWACGAVPSSAALPRIKVPWSQLKAMGLDMVRSEMAVISDQGDLILWVEKTGDKKLKAQGKVYMLRTMRLDWEKGATSMQTMWLPTSAIDNMALSPDSRTLFCISDKGTRFFVVDLASQKARVILESQKDRQGFSCHPPVVWYDKGKFCCPGFFYDETHAVTADAIGGFDPSRTGVEAVTKVRDLSAVHPKIENFAVAQWYNADEAYFGLMQQDQKTHLYHLAGNDLKPIDTMVAIGGIAVGASRVVYAAAYAPRKTGVVVFDQFSGKKWAVGDGKTIYNYLYMSKDGSTILVSDLNLGARKMTVFSGLDANNYMLKVIPDLQNVLPGAIRFSADGSTIAFINPEGLLVTRLKK